MRQHDGKIQDTYNIAFLGFIVLLITVAGIVVTVVLSYKDSTEKQTDAIYQLDNDKYEFLKEKIKYVEDRTTSQAAN